MRHIHLADIIGTISLFGLLISILMLIGTAGAVDCDTITLTDGVKRGAIWLIILVCSVIGIIREEREDDVYGGL